MSSENLRELPPPRPILNRKIFYCLNLTSNCYSLNQLNTQAPNGLTYRIKLFSQKKSYNLTGIGFYTANEEKIKTQLIRRLCRMYLHLL